MNLQVFKAQNPAYKDVPDDKLAGSLYDKFYSDKMGRDEFMAKVGIGAAQAEPSTADRLMKTGKDIVLATASGATGGYFDELAAKVHELRGVGNYDDNLKAIRARMEQIPMGASIPGEIIGGLGSAVAAAPVAGATKLGQMFGRLPPWLQSTGIGALFGGIYGSGNAEGGLEDRLAGAAVGAPVGAATGAAAHGVIRGVEGIAGKLAQGVRTMRDPEDAAIRKVAEAFNLDETNAARVHARLKSLGPQGMIADAGGENVLGLARGAAGTPGVAKNRIMQAIEGRAETESGRIGQAVKKGLQPRDYFDAEDAFLAKLKTNADALYKPAYEANPSVMTPRLEKMLENENIRDGIASAARMAANERAGGQPKWLGPVDKELTELASYAAEVGKMKPAGKVAQGFSLETWQRVKEGLDSVLKSTKYTNELTGKLNPEGRSIEVLRAALVRELDRATGGDKSLYALARKTYAGDAEVLSALRDGKNFMKLAPEEIRREVGQLSDAAKEAYRSGAARAIREVVDNVPDQASAANRLFGKSISRDKIRAIFPDTDSANEFARTMAAERRFAKTKNYIGSGSRTAPMLAEIDAVKNTLGNVGALAGSNMPGAHQLVASDVGRRLMQNILPQSQEANMALARILTTRNPAERLRYLDQLNRLGIGAPRSGTVDPMTAWMIAGMAGQEARLLGQSQ